MKRRCIMLKAIAIVFCLGLSVFHLNANDIQIDKEKNQNGRYQISSSGGQIYILDTQNGNTWMTYWSITDYQTWRQLPPIPIQN